MTPQNKVVSTMLNVIIPVCGIALLAVYHGLPVGNMSAVFAAVIAGVLVPIFQRFVGHPFLKACDIAYDSGTGYLFTGVCNLQIGLLSLAGVLP